MKPQVNLSKISSVLSSIKFKITLQNLLNTACTGEVRAFSRTFGSAAAYGGFAFWGSLGYLLPSRKWFWQSG